MGHVMVVLSAPQVVKRGTETADVLSLAWPKGAEEIWIVRTMESTRNSQGLHHADMLLHLESSGRLALLAELSADGSDISMIDGEAVQIWQCPGELRQAFRLDLMASVLQEMNCHQADWSLATAARAMLLSGSHFRSTDRRRMLQEVQECWFEQPICTSIVIIFWQRFLCHLANVGDAGSARSKRDAVDLIRQWMPLKADRVLPGQLLRTMRESGWRPLMTRSRSK